MELKCQIDLMLTGRADNVIVSWWLEWELSVCKASLSQGRIQANATDTPASVKKIYLNYFRSTSSK